MRVALVTIEYPPLVIGGAGIYVARLAEGLSNRGHDVHVFTPIPSDRSSLPASGSKVHLVPIPYDRRVPMAPQFWWRLRKSIGSVNERYDIVHLNSVSYPFLTTRRIYDAPIVLTMHHLARDAADANRALLGEKSFWSGTENGFFMRSIEQKCMDVSDHIIAVSEHTRKSIANHYGHEEKTSVIHEGVDPLDPIDGKIVDETRQSIIGRKDHLLLFVGRINDPRKGLDVLIRALGHRSELKASMLAVAGSGDATTLRQLAKEQGVLENVQFLGFVDRNKLMSLYRACDVSVTPSRLEGFGLTILEAGMAGKKVVASRVGAIPEIAGPGTFLVPPEDPSALADALVRALTSTGSSKQIRDWAASFSWEEMVRRTEIVYTQTLENFKSKQDVARSSLAGGDSERGTNEAH